MPMSLGANLMLGSSGLAPFTPQSLGSSLVAWWDPDSGITKDPVSNRISSWVDRIGGVTVSQATGSRQPLFVASSANMNNRAAVNFDLVAQSLLASPSPASLNVQQQQNTYLAVVRGDKDAIGTGGITSGNVLLMLFSTKVRVHVWFSALRTQDGLTTVATTTKAMIGQMTDATNVYPILNGAKDNVGVAISPATTVTPSTSFLIGSRATGSNQSFIGLIGDVFVINRALTDNELERMYRWAQTRWGL